MEDRGADGRASTQALWSTPGNTCLMLSFTVNTTITVVQVLTSTTANRQQLDNKMAAGIHGLELSKIDRLPSILQQPPKLKTMLCVRLENGSSLIRALHEGTKLHGNSVLSTLARSWCRGLTWYKISPALSCQAEASSADAV